MYTADVYSELTLRHSPNFIHFLDPDTYGLCYMNPSAKAFYNVREDREYQGQKCYALLHGRTTPCPDCDNGVLSGEDFKEHYQLNEYRGRYLKCSSRLVTARDGRALRMEVATDVTDFEDRNRQLGLRAESDRVLVQCIHSLNQNTDLRSAVESMLALVGEFYGANRAYIFEFDLKNSTLSNTYEWCKEGVSAEKENLQKLPLEVIDSWMVEFKAKGSFHLTSVGKNLDKISREYQILAAQNIESLIAAPLLENGQITGFIGVDDPTRRTAMLDLLTSVTYFVVNDIQKRRMTARLERLSYTDLLTGLYNRNRYIQDMTALQQQGAHRLGLLVVDVNGLKRTNDEYGHQAGDALIRKVAGLMSELFGKKVYRVGGDEFVVICPDADMEEFCRQAQLLSDRMETTAGRLASVGQVWTEGAEALSQLVAAADRDMYRQKKEYHKSVGQRD